jgi:CRISPR-associated helicase Cas3/CRISPR-associated endonuclease Cas3-HD
MAAGFCRAWGGDEEALAAGLLHDLGKYGNLFQARLRGEVGGIDHWSAGAAEALRRYCQEGIATALVVQGHHLGLQVADPDELRRLDPRMLAEHLPQGVRLSDPGLDNLLIRLSADGLSLPPRFCAGDANALRDPAVSAMLDVRMLYSAVVDADFLDTEAHFSEQAGVGRPRDLPLDPSHALVTLNSYVDHLAAASTASPRICNLRDDLRRACLEAALRPPGLFTFTAPTGTGKTLGMLAFALRHALQHQLRRIVTVIPYLSIIEQTVNAYRQALAGAWTGDHLGFYLLEDHSLAGTHGELGTREPSDEETLALRGRLAENWDAPLVVTTSVQFLESLFANRPGACRKLHRLAKSVIMFDEVQTLPARLAVPTLAALSRLVERYGCTVVFSTATQPAFSHLDKHVRHFCRQGWEPEEIVPHDLHLFERARRVEVKWPHSVETMAWGEVAEELGAYSQVLCIVNLKRHAWALLDQLQARDTDGLLHLSTNMCPAHRRQVLEEVRSRLDPEQPQPCCLVSTQCVEAGVDVDFPVVYRAWGPLEAIAQAAGRCNRNGRAESGRVRVFVPETEGTRELYPDDAYRQAADVAQVVLAELGAEGIDLDAPAVFERYYRRLYEVQDPTRYCCDRTNDPLIRAICERSFPKVAQEYRLIKQDALNVLVPFEPRSFDALAAEVRETGLTYSWIRRARPHTVSLFRPRPDSVVMNHLEPVRLARGRGESEEWFIYRTPEHYHERRGLMPPQADAVLIA